MKTPSRAETGNASADDDYPDFLGSLGCGKCRVIAEAMAERETVVNESAVDAFFGFGGESNEGGGGYCAEESPSRRHLFSVALPGRMRN